MRPQSSCQVPLSPLFKNLDIEKLQLQLLFLFILRLKTKRIWFKFVSEMKIIKNGEHYRPCFILEMS